MLAGHKIWAHKTFLCRYSADIVARCLVFEFQDLAEVELLNARPDFATGLRIALLTASREHHHHLSPLQQ
jgi:hypothetical protein